MAEIKGSDDFEGRLVRYAETLGRLAGTVRGKADGLLDRAALAQHLKDVRDGAADLLTRLAPAPAPAKRRTRTPAAKAVARDIRIAAPGKRHRASLPPVHGVKHSDQRVSKLKTASMKGRRRGRG